MYHIFLQSLQQNKHKYSDVKYIIAAFPKFKMIIVLLLMSFQHVTIVMKYTETHKTETINLMAINTGVTRYDSTQYFREESC
jgi:hypothetical protein